MDNYLYTSANLEEWKMDREDMANGLIVADVDNKSWGFSEVGTIGICPGENGTLERNDVGYDFDAMNQQNYTIDDLPFDDKPEVDLGHEIEI